MPGLLKYPLAPAHCATCDPASSANRARPSSLVVQAGTRRKSSCGCDTKKTVIWLTRGPRADQSAMFASIHAWLINIDRLLVANRTHRQTDGRVLIDIWQFVARWHRRSINFGPKENLLSHLSLHIRLISLSLYIQSVCDLDLYNMNTYTPHLR